MYRLIVLSLAIAVLASMCNAETQPSPFTSHLVQPCISVQTVDIQPNHTLTDPREDSVILSCLIIQATTAYIRTGNYSVSENVVSCSSQVAYSYSFSAPQTLPTAGATHFCVQSNNPQQYATSFCAFSKAEGNTVYISAAVSEQQVASVSQLPFLATTVNFNFGNLLPMFAYRAAMAFSRSVTDPGELRRRIFTGTGRYPSCTFYPSDQPTNRPCIALSS
eukprot:TRINITY_DN6325_c0_g1_i1.p1 TRINITY_DN6325_c0_g1~~TRINITY_DN6325_c0_g1_i1.p1  ORF type:complete len:220 (+),score=21.80 TRINITY_DN6325_c0_g1_i1:217-876(+)